MGPGPELASGLGIHFISHMGPGPELASGLGINFISHMGPGPELASGLGIHFISHLVPGPGLEPGLGSSTYLASGPRAGARTRTGQRHLFRIWAQDRSWPPDWASTYLEASNPLGTP